ncbi:centromere protein K [Pimephales promelas]|nr:centromere protein K [Pimephales promelas]
MEREVYAHKQRSSKIIERPRKAYDASGDVMTLLLASPAPSKQTEMEQSSPSSYDAGCMAAKAVLLEDCEQQFGMLQKLQNEIILADTEADDEAVNRLLAITTELEQWQEMEPKLLITNPEVLVAVGKEELQRLNSQLKMVLSYSQSKLDAQKKILKREQTWQAEKKEALDAVSEKITRLRHENEKSEHSVLQDMKRKINNLKDYQSSLMEMLSDMLAEHFPLPDPVGNGTKKKRAAAYDAEINLISLSEIIEQNNKRIEVWNNLRSCFPFTIYFGFSGDEDLQCILLNLAGIDKRLSLLCSSSSAAFSYVTEMDLPSHVYKDKIFVYESCFPFTIYFGFSGDEDLQCILLNLAGIDKRLSLLCSSSSAAFSYVTEMDLPSHVYKDKIFVYEAGFSYYGSSLKVHRHILKSLVFFFFVFFFVFLFFFRMEVKPLAAHRAACGKVEDSLDSHHSKFGVSNSIPLAPPTVQTIEAIV